MAAKSSSFRNWQKSDNVKIIRGFQDRILEFLGELSLITKMPHFLQNKNQHTVIWVNEAINDLIKIL